ncbi:OsmC family protein [Hazenella sp. IB182357]|uniref:OsmC family protein n=1 Tax=Polycladospora coralii TaxID=2771432 RepID=A0A926RVA5_9BACL|nr:OsmC family protein [Polycladospora coralii]MBD1373592.1 OsmC family protein [Polycladospora coralii]MBS7531962.1 OsmC family protein [Polycladospora coralii]
MRVAIQWNGKMSFTSELPSGHRLEMDAAPEVGGENKGPRPTEALLSAVGTCSGIDIVDILRKMRLQVDEFDMEIEAERAAEHPRRFTKMNIHYKLTGDLPVEKVKRAVQLSIEKYCSVSHSLSALITTSFEINGTRYEEVLD